LGRLASRFPPPQSPSSPLPTPPRDHPTSVYNPPWPTPTQFRCTYEYTKGVLFRCKHTFCSLYFCGRRYCPKGEYFVTTVDGYLHKTVPLPGNTCQLQPDITENGSTLQYISFEVADFIRSCGTRLPGPSAQKANTNTLPRITVYCIYIYRRTMLDCYTRYPHTSCDDGNTNSF